MSNQEIRDQKILSTLLFLKTRNSLIFTTSKKKDQEGVINSHQRGASYKSKIRENVKNEISGGQFTLL